MTQLEFVAKKLDKPRPSALQRSIDDVTDPTKNSINEKCARIREAFVSQFDERLAEHYIVTGERNTPKRIKLSPNLLVWE